MNATLATTEKASVAIPDGFVNPLTIDDAVSRVDGVVNAMIDGAVGHVENEIKGTMRRREVAAAVRGILRTRTTLEEMIADPAGMKELTLMAIDGERANLLSMFSTVNPAASFAAVASVVDGLLEKCRGKLFPEPEAGEEDEKPKKKRGK